MKEFNDLVGYLQYLVDNLKKCQQPKQGWKAAKRLVGAAEVLVTLVESDPGFEKPEPLPVYRFAKTDAEVVIDSGVYRNGTDGPIVKMPDEPDPVKRDDGSMLAELYCLYQRGLYRMAKCHSKDWLDCAGRRRLEYTFILDELPIDKPVIVDAPPTGNVSS